jgi:predicted DNA-binding protein
MSTQKITVKVPEATYKRLVKKMEDTGEVSISAVVRHAIEAYLSDKPTTVDQILHLAIEAAIKITQGAPVSTSAPAPAKTLQVCIHLACLVRS